MTWLQATPTLLVGIVIVLLPGTVVGLTAGARPWLAVGAAPAVSTGVLSLAAIALQEVKLPWSITTAALVTAIIATLCLAIRIGLHRLGRRHRVRRESTLPLMLSTMGPLEGSTRVATAPRWHWTIMSTITGVVVGGGIVGFRVTQMVVAPGNLSQTPDNIFHQNALRMIVETGRASSLTLGNLDPTAQSLSFYPGAWHAMTSLIMLSTGASTAVATNIMSVVIGAIIWPLSIVLLLRILFGRKALLLLAGGLLSAAFGIFPYLPLFFGVLYPNTLAIALFPGCIALVAACLGVCRDVSATTVTLLALTGSAVVGTFLAHPSVGLLVLASTVPLVVAWSIRVTQNTTLVRKVALPLVVCTSYFAILCFLWSKLRPSAGASQWKPIRTVAQAVGEAITSAPLWYPLSTVVAVFTAVGVWYLLRQKTAPAICLVVIGLTTMWFYVVSASWLADSVRDAITRVWYNDSYRTGSQIAAVAAPIAAVGLAAALSGLMKAVRWLTRHLAAPVSSLIAAVVVLLGAASVTAWSQDYSVSYGQIVGQGNYRLNDHSPLLDTDEAEIVDRIASIVGVDDVIANVPGDGSGFIYALTGRRTALMTAQGTPSGSTALVYDQLDHAGSNEAICKALDLTRIRYLVAFGGEVNLMKHNYPAFRNLAENPSVKLIERVGHAELYRIEGCSTKNS